MQEENSICSIILYQGQSNEIGERKKKNEDIFDMSERGKKRKRMIDVECRDMHNPVNTTRRE